MSKILFVEDDELMSDMYSLILHEPEFTVEIFKHGLEGIARAKEWQPDLILLDMMMPGMNGMEILHMLKKNDSTASIPVAMLSNLFDDSFIKEARDSGAVEYFIKSEFNGKEMREKIKNILEKS